MAALLSAKSPAAHIPELLEAGVPVTFGCRVPDFDEARYFSHVERRRLDRTTRLGLAAAADAAADAGAGFAADPRRGGVYVGTGAANLTSTVALGGHEHAGSLERVPVTTVPTIMSNTTAAHVALRHGLQGPCMTFAAACASGTVAIGEAALALRTGRADAALAGGVDSLLAPFAMAAFARIGALSKRNEAPAEASRPFDGDRDGFVMGEAAAFLALERAQDAVARGATIYGEVRGYATANDAFHVVMPREDGEVAAACMREALADAGLRPQDIGHVNAHGTATGFNDRAEARAMEWCFGAGAVPPVTGTKGVTGHMLGAAGAFEAAIAVLCARDGIVPPTANFTCGPDADLIDLVHGSPRTIAPGPVLSNSFGFGGHDASLVLTPWPSR